MAQDSTVFVGIDAAQLKHAVAVAELGRSGDVRYIGGVDASPDAARKLLTRLTARHGKLHVCYEAGPTGYGLHRQVVALGHACMVAASLIPRKPGDRVMNRPGGPAPLLRFFRRRRGSGGEEHTTPEKAELGAPEGLPLQKLQFVHLFFRLPAARA